MERGLLTNHKTMMNEPENLNNLTATQTRKDDHIRICLDEKVQAQQVTNGLEKYQFTHCCLPHRRFDPRSFALSSHPITIRFMEQMLTRNL